MAIRVSTSTSGFSSNAVPTNTSFTMMGWFMIVTDRNAYSTFISYGTLTGGNKKVLQTGGDGTTLVMWDGTTEFTGSALTVGTWYHITLTHDGTTPKGYLNGVLDVTGASGVDPTTRFEIGQSEDVEWLDGTIGPIKIWNVVLTTTEMIQEMRQYHPVTQVASLFAWYPALHVSTFPDYSGHGNDLSTGGGTVAVIDGPPIPWKQGRHRLMIPAPAGAASGWGPLYGLHNNRLVGTF